LSTIPPDFIDNFSCTSHAGLACASADATGVASAYADIVGSTGNPRVLVQRQMPARTELTRLIVVTRPW
jgi:hypothetical protein